METSTHESETKPYGFGDKLAEGIRGEQDIVTRLAQWYSWTPATHEEQRCGIDGILTCKRTGRRWATEIKADSRAAKTGNLFIETVSVNTSGKLGWAYTSLAQLLVYYIPPEERAYIVAMTEIKMRLVEWLNQYPTRRIPNDGYHTEGLLLPLVVFVRDCKPIVLELGNNGAY